VELLVVSVVVVTMLLLESMGLTFVGSVSENWL